MGPLAKTLLWTGAVVFFLTFIGMSMFASTEARQAALGALLVILALIFAGVGLKK